MSPSKWMDNIRKCLDALVSKIHIANQESFQFERSFSCLDHGEIPLYEYLERMIAVFGDNAKVGFAFLLSMLFLDVVKKSSQRLALLNIFGRKGTGKTELDTALMSFFVKQNDPSSLATTSMASLNEMLSNAENNLVHKTGKLTPVWGSLQSLHGIWGTPKPVLTTITPVDFFEAECRRETVKASGNWTDTATLKFRCADLLPLHLHLGFVVTDNNGSHWLIGAKEPPFPKLKAELAAGKPDGDAAGYSYEVTHVSLKTLIPCII